jgi:hypothetical protein
MAFRRGRPGKAVTLLEGRHGAAVCYNGCFGAANRMCKSGNGRPVLSHSDRPSTTNPQAS